MTVAKMKKKKESFYSQQFKAEEDPSQWPEGVIQNPSSSTGFSYLTLNFIPAPIGDGSVTQDGFEISSGQWILRQNSVVFLLNTSDVEKYLENS